MNRALPQSGNRVLTPAELSVDLSPQDQGGCFLCGRSGHPVVWQENGFSGHACPCGVTYVSPMPPPRVESLRYDAHLDTYYAIPAKRRLRFVRQICPDGRLLEVGCGDGYFLRAAQGAGYSVFGVEANPKLAEQVQKETGIECIAVPIEQWHDGDERFDIIFHVDLLSHFPDPLAALAAMVRRLNPGGVLCFEVGLLGGLSSTWYRWCGGVGFPEHRWLFNQAGLLKTLDQAGLEVIRIQRFSLALTVARLVLGRTLIKPLLRFSRGLTRQPRRPAAGTSPDASASPLLPSWLMYPAEVVHYFLRYSLGRLLPNIGPQTLFVAVRPR